MESFSIVIMEAWLCGRPVLVNARCPVTVEHCRQSQGGLFFEDYLEFESCLHALLKRPDLSRNLAENGRRYVLDHFHWDRVSEKFIHLFRRTWEKIGSPRPSAVQETPMAVPPNPIPSKAVHQLLPDFSYGDAIGNDVLGIQKVLRSWGLEFGDLCPACAS